MIIETTRSDPATRFVDGPLGGLVLTGDDKTTGPPLRSNEDYTRCTSRRSPLILPERGSQWGFGAPGTTLGNQSRPPNDPGLDCRGGLAASNQAAAGWNDLSHNIAARSHHPSGVNAARVDGYITFVRDTISPQVWRGMATRANGEVWESDPD